MEIQDAHKIRETLVAAADAAPDRNAEIDALIDAVTETTRLLGWAVAKIEMLQGKVRRLESR